MTTRPTLPGRNGRCASTCTRTTADWRAGTVIVSSAPGADWETSLSSGASRTTCWPAVARIDTLMGTSAKLPITATRSAGETSVRMVLPTKLSDASGSGGTK